MGCPGVFFFFRPFPAGSLCRRRTCPGLIPGFFFFFFPRPFPAGCPGLNLGLFFIFYFLFFKFFFRPFSTGSLCRRRTCLGLIPGFFFFFPRPFPAGCQGLIPGFFFFFVFFPPFSGGLPKVNTRVFFFFFSSTLFKETWGLHSVRRSRAPN